MRFTQSAQSANSVKFRQVIGQRHSWRGTGFQPLAHNPKDARTGCTCASSNTPRHGSRRGPREKLRCGPVSPLSGRPTHSDQRAPVFPRCPALPQTAALEALAHCRRPADQSATERLGRVTRWRCVYGWRVWARLCGLTQPVSFFTSADRTPNVAEGNRRMDILARQSWAQPATSAGGGKLTFCDVYDTQAIARLVPLMTDRNVHPALPVCNAGFQFTWMRSLL